MARIGCSIQWLASFHVNNSLWNGKTIKSCYCISSILFSKQQFHDKFICPRQKVKTICSNQRPNFSISSSLHKSARAQSKLSRIFFTIPKKPLKFLSLSLSLSLWPPAPVASMFLRFLGLIMLDDDEKEEEEENKLACWWNCPYATTKLGPKRWVHSALLDRSRSASECSLALYCRRKTC